MKRTELYHQLQTLSDFAVPIVFANAQDIVPQTYIDLRQGQNEDNNVAHLALRLGPRQPDITICVHKCVIYMPYTRFGGAIFRLVFAEFHELEAEVLVKYHI